MTQRKALVLGATGGIGGEMASALLRHGWQVHALHRNPAAVSTRHPGMTWVQGDAMSRADVIRAAQGASLIVHGVNPPRYHNWGKLAVPMLKNTIAAAQASGARICFPGTVYNFGPETFPLVAEDAPQRPRTRKGAIRVEMEALLRAATEDGMAEIGGQDHAAPAGGRAKVLVLRTGDYFGPLGSGNTWFASAMVKPGRKVTSVTYPGRPAVGHAWAYLPDMAETAMRLLEHPALPDFAVFHFGGHWFEHGVELAEAVRTVLGNPRLPIRGFPWWLVWAASPFVEMFREMREMRYLWQQPLRLDNRRLLAFLGEEPHTPVHTAIRETLVGLGCLKDAQAELAADTSAASAARAQPLLAGNS